MGKPMKTKTLLPQRKDLKSSSPPSKPKQKQRSSPERKSTNKTGSARKTPSKLPEASSVSPTPPLEVRNPLGRVGQLSTEELEQAFRVLTGLQEIPLSPSPLSSLEYAEWNQVAHTLCSLLDQRSHSSLQ